MRLLVRIIVMTVVVCLATACTRHHTRVDVAQCEANGGEVMPVCLSGVPACVTPYADAGQACSDSSECEGMCLYEGSPDLDAEVTGSCQRDDNPCGCFGEVVDGKAQVALCVD